jgi:FMN hydrolase / 5-amino-6-(5-phospho-D-ribitylamino)uracil phosphatase
MPCTDLQIAAITLDLDDTLWPIEPVMRHAERRLHDWLQMHCPRAAAAYPIEGMRALRDRITQENPHLAHDFSAQRRLSLHTALREHGYGDDHVESAYAEFYAARNEVECYADALPALARLAARFPLVSLTNGNADIERIGLAHLFRFSLSSRDCGVAKPAPEIFHAACARLGLPPHAVLHVGDDPELDVAGARAAGLRTAWINRGGAAWPRSDRPDLVTSDLAELADRLDAVDIGGASVHALA